MLQKCLRWCVLPCIDQSDLIYLTPRAATRKWASYILMLAFSGSFVINAPFGRFTLSGESVFLLDGVYYSGCLRLTTR